MQQRPPSAPLAGGGYRLPPPPGWAALSWALPRQPSSRPLPGHQGTLGPIPQFQPSLLGLWCWNPWKDPASGVVPRLAVLPPFFPLPTWQHLAVPPTRMGLTCLGLHGQECTWAPPQQGCSQGYLEMNSQIKPAAAARPRACPRVTIPSDINRSRGLAVALASCSCASSGGGCETARNGGLATAAQRTRARGQQDWWRVLCSSRRVLGQLWGLSVLICKIRSPEAVEMSDYGYTLLSA